MKKINKLIMIGLIFLFSIFLPYQNISQAETKNEWTPKSKDDVVSFDESIFDNQIINNGNVATKASLSHAVTVSVNPSSTGVSIIINNYGVDTLDWVSVKLIAPSYIGQQYVTKTITKTNIKPFSASRATMNIPMRKTVMSYKGNVTIKEGKKIAVKNTYSSLSFSEEILSKEWHKGTFKNVRSTVDHHFAKHYNDKAVKVTNITQYLNKAADQRAKVKNITKSTSRYTVKKKPADRKYLASIKVTDKKTKAYVMMINDKSKKIFSYGGDY